MIQTSMLLEEKIKKAIDRLKTFEPPDGYWLAFSGGKDSIVIHYLALLAGVKFESHYNHTTVDPPELIYFIQDNYKDNYKDVIIDYPDITMWKLIVKRLMPPTRIVRYCCDVLKERGGEGRFVVTGIRWAESNKRSYRGVVENVHKNKKYRLFSNDNDEARLMLESCVKKGKFTLNPIIDWTDNEVWQFIYDYKLKYCSLYDQGYSRLGCIGCPMAYIKKRKQEFARYPIYQKNYIKAFDRMIENRLHKGKETTWRNGQDCFNWWLR